jgi:hypothetical protein
MSEAGTSTTPVATSSSTATDAKKTTATPLDSNDNKKMETEDTMTKSETTEKVLYVDPKRL